MLVIRPIKAQETIELRHQVMWPDLPKEAVVLPEDAEGLHFGAFLGEDLIGAGSFFFDDKRVRLRKLAVAEAHQGQNVATRLLSAAIKHLKAGGYESLWCDARVSASAFYERNGFCLSPDVFQKRGIDYVVAKRLL